MTVNDLSAELRYDKFVQFAHGFCTYLPRFSVDPDYRSSSSAYWSYRCSDRRGVLHLVSYYDSRRVLWLDTRSCPSGLCVLECLRPFRLGSLSLRLDRVAASGQLARSWLVSQNFVTEGELCFRVRRPGDEHY